MESIIHSESYKHKRRFYVVLPLLIAPFLTVGFWLMGGGSDSAQQVTKAKGLNTQLPAAQVKRDSARDKMSFYQVAEADSVKRAEQMRMDPYRTDSSTNHPFRNSVLSHPQPISRTNSRIDRDEQPIADKIAAIQRQIVSSSKPGILTRTNQREPQETTLFNEPDNLRKTDPELEALNSMLDKIQGIQHPEREKEKSAQKKGTAFDVQSKRTEEETYFGNKDTVNRQHRFYSDRQQSNSYANAISAMIPTDQILQNGSVVKLQLGAAISINGITVPPGSYVFGTAAIQNERLLIHIPSILSGSNLLPVSLSVFDMDGLEGIYVPGSLSREVAKESADHALQSVGISGFDLSIKTQVAAAGIGAAKSLFSKKAKQVRVTVSAGYRVLLRDDKTKNE